MAYHIIHKTDKAYEGFYASEYDYALRLFFAILEEHPELKGHLEIVEV
jgi:hypothetical protein